MVDPAASSVSRATAAVVGPDMMSSGTDPSSPPPRTVQMTQQHGAIQDCVHNAVTTGTPGASAETNEDELKTDSTKAFEAVPVLELDGHDHDILDLCWSKNHFLLSSSMDTTVKLWHISTSEYRHNFIHLLQTACIRMCLLSTYVDYLPLSISRIFACCSCYYRSGSEMPTYICARRLRDLC